MFIVAKLQCLSLQIIVVLFVNYDAEKGFDQSLQQISPTEDVDRHKTLAYFCQFVCLLSSQKVSIKGTLFMVFSYIVGSRKNCIQVVYVHVPPILFLDIFFSFFCNTSSISNNSKLILAIVICTIRGGWNITDYLVTLNNIQGNLILSSLNYCDAPNFIHLKRC